MKPAVKRVTKTKKATAKKPVADEDNSDEEDNVVPEITFNADEFKSRPLNKAHGATRLSGAAKDWEGNCKPLFAKKAFPMMVEVASNAVDLAENDEDAEAVSRSKATSRARNEQPFLRSSRNSTLLCVRC